MVPGSTSGGSDRDRSGMMVSAAMPVKWSAPIDIAKQAAPPMRCRTVRHCPATAMASTERLMAMRADVATSPASQDTSPATIMPLVPT